MIKFVTGSMTISWPSTFDAMLGSVVRGDCFSPKLGITSMRSFGVAVKHVDVVV